MREIKSVSNKTFKMFMCVTCNLGNIGSVAILYDYIHCSKIVLLIPSYETCVCLNHSGYFVTVFGPKLTIDYHNTRIF